MTRNGNTSIVIPTERSDEESPKCTAKRDPSHTFGMTGNGNTSIVIPNAKRRNLKQAQLKRDPSHTFGMTNMLDYVISNEREKSLKNIANK